MQSAMECAAEQTDHKMGSNGPKNDIKTLFFIANTLHGLIGGLFPLCAWLEIVMNSGGDKEAVISLGAVTVVMVMPMLSLTALGYHGAIIANTKLLHIYSAMTVITTFGLMAATDALGYWLGPGVFSILDSFVMMTAVWLSLAVAKHAGDDGRASAIPPCYKRLIIGFVVTAVLLVGYVFYTKLIFGYVSQHI